MIVSAMIPGSELFTVESNNTNATTPRSVALVATDRLDGCGALSEMVLKKDHRILHLTSGRCVYPKGTQHNIHNLVGHTMTPLISLLNNCVFMC